MSLWSEYVAERDGSEVIEKDFGFIQYRMQGEACVIDEIYVKPEFRMQGRGLELFEQVCGRARLSGKKAVLSELYVTRMNATEALKAQLAAGFIPIAAEAGIIVLKYELGGSGG